MPNELTSMDIAVTGGRGYIGRHLVARLAREGHRVRMLSRSAEPVAGENAHAVGVVVGDLGDKRALAELVDEADVVFHCAGEIVDEAKMIETNVLGTVNLLVAMSESSTKLVHLSSVGVYGPTSLEVVDPTIARRPKSLYESTKAAAEAIVLRAADLGEVSAIVIQPSTVVSADMPNDSIRALSRAVLSGRFILFGAGDARANYVHVSDVVDALYLARSAQSGSVYIVSNECSIREMVEAIRQVSPVHPRPVWRMPIWMGSVLAAPGLAFPGLPLNPSRLAALINRTRYDTTPIERDLGFFPSVSVQASIAEVARLSVELDR